MPTDSVHAAYACRSYFAPIKSTPAPYGGARQSDCYTPRWIGKTCPVCLWWRRRGTAPRVQIIVAETSTSAALYLGAFTAFVN